MNDKNDPKGQVRIEDLKRSIDLVELFGSYGIDVKQRGAQHECACPFHDGDDTPSLKITPEKGLWNCFGCDAGGSVIDLVMKMDKVDVAEARKILLKRIPHIAPLSKLEAERSEASGQKSEDSSQSDAVKKKKYDLCSLPSVSLLKAIFDHAHKTLIKPGCDGLKYLSTRREKRVSPIIADLAVDLVVSVIKECGYGTQSSNRIRGCVLSCDQPRELSLMDI